MTMTHMSLRPQARVAGVAGSNPYVPRHWEERSKGTTKQSHAKQSHR